MSGRHGTVTPETARRLTLDTEPYLSCDDCFALMDQCVDNLVDHREKPSIEIRVHLAACTVCREDFHSLIELVAKQEGVDPTPLLPLLEN